MSSQMESNQQDGNSSPDRGQQDGDFSPVRSQQDASSDPQQSRRKLSESSSEGQVQTKKAKPDDTGAVDPDRFAVVFSSSDEQSDSDKESSAGGSASPASAFGLPALFEEQNGSEDSWDRHERELFASPKLTEADEAKLVDMNLFIRQARKILDEDLCRRFLRLLQNYVDSNELELLTDSVRDLLLGDYPDLLERFLALCTPAVIEAERGLPDNPALYDRLELVCDYIITAFFTTPDSSPLQQAEADDLPVDFGDDLQQSS